MILNVPQPAKQVALQLNTAVATMTQIVISRPTTEAVKATEEEEINAVLF